MQPSVDAVIVNWKAGAALRACLASLLAGGESPLRRVVVVDNASGDECRNLRDEFPIELIENPVNRGFAAGCNGGARSSRADYLLFLNPDLILAKDAIRKVVSFFESPDAQHVGIVGIRMINADGGPALSCSHFPTLRSMIAEMTGLDGPPGTFRSRHMRPAELRNSREVDQVIGAFFAVRRSVFEALGGFDENFFLYFEEVDFALRARRLGWASYFLAEAEAIHAGRVSSSQSKGMRLFYFVRSRLIYCRKHLGPLRATVVLLFSILVEPAARIAKAIAGLSDSTPAQVLEGYGKLYAAGARSFRSKIQGQAKVLSDGHA